MVICVTINLELKRLETRLTLTHIVSHRRVLPAPLPGAMCHPQGMRRATLVRIEKAVMDLFARHEFHQVALRDVASHAHVSLQTIYKYFGGKEQLVSWVIDHTLTRLALRMIEQLETIEDFKQRLGKTLWIMLDFFDKQPQLMSLLSMTTPAAQYKSLSVYESPELMGAFLGLFKTGQQKGQLRQHIPTRLHLDVFMGILTRVVQMHHQRRETSLLIEQHAVLMDILWGALRAEPT